MGYCGEIGYMIFYDFSTLLMIHLGLGLKFASIVEWGMSFHGVLNLGVLAMLLLPEKFTTIHHHYRFYCTISSKRLGIGKNWKFYQWRIVGEANRLFFRFLGFKGRRHPTQLYEAFFEGFFVLILWFFSQAKNNRYSSAVFLISMGY
ncbi:MAG: hypothetical protein Ct9H300mP4_08240 [Gammaproteobacteria bacterium]|nr:MAG: hypothetical protein Ct9H300mP4_08240 [Gammaproteobacteria bacterium]